MRNNCGHLANRNDGNICEYCGFICCDKCVIGTLCSCCDSNITPDFFIWNNYPNSQKCKKCNRICRDIKTETIKREEKWYHHIPDIIIAILIGLGGGMWGGFPHNNYYYRTYHHCTKCNLEFHEDVNELKTKI
jgi:hypothetical protein